MSKSYVIEVGDDQAGLILREDGERDYLFHAALDAYNALDGRRFANAFLAERAAVAHAASRRRRREHGPARKFSRPDGRYPFAPTEA